MSFVQAINLNSPRKFPLPTAQIASGSGDLNNDGFPDLITGGIPGSPSIGKIYVSLGKGNGSFYPSQDYRVGHNESDLDAPFVEGIKIWDLNNDGNPDVVVAHNGERSFLNLSNTFITVLLGDGQGGFQSNISYVFDNPGGQFLTSFDLADMNNDHLMDVIFSIRSGSSFSSIYLLRNLGSGNFHTFGAKLFGALIYGIAGGKFNNDNLPDLVVATNRGSYIGFGGKEVYPNEFVVRDMSMLERELTAADLNRDGRTDFVVSPYPSQQIRVFINGKNGIPENPKVYQTAIAPQLIKTADLNGDGNLDIVFIEGQSIQIFYGNGDGTLGSSQLIENSGNPSLSFADFDQNGKMDLGAAFGSGGGVFLNAPNPGRYYTDFNGDRVSDLTIYRPDAGTWWTLFGNSSATRTIRFGLSTDRIVPGNFDGDNRADIGVYRDGTWYILQSSDNLVKIDFWGITDDIPVPGDFDNDGKMNLAVFRPSEGIWYIKNESGFNSVKWGVANDKPVPADYDGDGKTDIAVFRPMNGTWYILSSKDGSVVSLNFGLDGDWPVPADYDGDGKSDIAVYRDGTWYLLQSDSGFTAFQFGIDTDVPVPADYDGDGRSDPAVFRDGTWYLLQSTNGIQIVRFGLANDKPSAAIVLENN